MIHELNNLGRALYGRKRDVLRVQIKMIKQQKPKLVTSACGQLSRGDQRMR